MTVQLDLRQIVGASHAGTCPACGSAIREGASITAHAFYEEPVHLDCEGLLTLEQQQRLRNEQPHFKPVDDA